MKKETLEEVINRIYGDDEDGMYINKIDFKDGAKWQQERSYSDMQEYAEYSMECLRLGEDCLFAKEWFEQFKNK